MSHQTGISASEELTKLFAEAKDKDYRLVQVGIDVENEKLVPLAHREKSETWEKDYDVFIPSLLDDEAPCYLFYRLDETNSNGKYWWIMIVFSPEDAEVRYKMLYAATKTSLKSIFGSGQIKTELYENDKADVTYSGYQRHIEEQEAPAPLTASEEEQLMMKGEEGHTDIGSSTKQSHLHGMMFPIQQNGLDALQGLKSDDYSYVRLTVDITNEEILLGEADTIEVDQLSSKVSAEEAGYHLFNFKHTHEGDFLQSIVLIYLVPGYDCPVKERMVYTSLLGPLSSYLQVALEFDIAKRIEISAGDILTRDFLQAEVHPIRNVHRPAFAKPKGPANKRGQRRLLKDEELV